MRWRKRRHSVERTNRVLYAVSLALILLGVLTYIYGAWFSRG